MLKNVPFFFFALIVQRIQFCVFKCKIGMHAIGDS
jgi:hypothetical protein